MDEAEFTSSLFKGLGRPHCYYQRHKDFPYREALLHACLYNPAYDHQIEGARTNYYWELLNITACNTDIRQNILEALRNPVEEMDIEQLFGFALNYARSGDTVARQLMYSLGAEYACAGSTVGAEQLVELDNIDAFLFIAEHRGRTNEAQPDFWDNDFLLKQIEKHLSAEKIQEQLKKAQQTNVFIARYFTLISSQDTARTLKPSLSQQPYEEIKRIILESQRRIASAVFYRWGKLASDDDIYRAAQDLLTLTDTKIIPLYLGMFCKRTFPFGLSPLLPLVWSNEERVASYAIRAVAMFHDSQVRALALQLIAAKHHTSDAIKLFIHNFQAGDELFLTEIFEQNIDDDDLHSLICSLIDVFEQNLTQSSQDLLIALYEQSPCSICRQHIVDCLVKLASLPDWIIDECQYDANEKIRLAVHQYCEAKQSQF
ncbi:hypothetical protein DSM106972_048010 [Dulcicalothrix desertica PCC 7102]|uniref:Uncharacterized protein n=1 Tax=Dulcicalothrix desertica PCC 7102 TaxID=232991 RepID=A0A3S1CBC6_9CYAN|nr:hypothetical protein [Dulcicalothrix desertica]RUT03887.1 hypothetical protein DSM106972_048010 [Dulcicalothrix desertica PCC 7102]TWH43702.1 hypothetical protein CAL7102_07446 [Dulcicalothrix desertica PCC 7102]